MNNSNIINSIIEMIQKETERRNISQEALANLCSEKAIKSGEKGVSQSTISNMFRKPSSVTVSTLLKVCNGLDLSLFAIFRALNNSLSSSTNSNLIYDIHSSAFNGYLFDMYIYFLETNSTQSERLVCGKLQLGDFYHTNECVARLKIATSQKSAPKESPTKEIKEYEGNVSIYQNHSMYLHLVSNQYGDVWSLIFNHKNLNQQNLVCSFGCGVTLSSGKDTRFPTIHFVCLSNQKLSTENEEVIRNRLRIHNKQIVLTEDRLNDFLTNEHLDATFRENLEICRKRSAAKAVIIPFSALTSFVDSQIAYESITRLMKYSCNETAYHIEPEEDTKLFKSML